MLNLKFCPVFEGLYILSAFGRLADKFFTKKNPGTFFEKWSAIDSLFEKMKKRLKN